MKIQCPQCGETLDEGVYNKRVQRNRLVINKFEPVRRQWVIELTIMSIILAIYLGFLINGLMELL